MRAFAVMSFGEEPTAVELPSPDSADSFLIRVNVAGANPIDYKVLDGLTESSSYPHVAGFDFAGVIEKVPADEKELHVGDRVFGSSRVHGSYAEFTAIPQGPRAQSIALIPEGVDDINAAALPIPATTALGALDLLGIEAGKLLVITGATGGVGGYAVQIARSRGVHVIATVRGDIDQALSLGAEEAYDTSRGDFLQALKAAHPEGVDAVLDLVNDREAIKENAEILKSGGAIVSSIFAADEAWFAERDITAQNIGSNNNQASSRRGLDEVVRLLADGRVTARVRSVVDLEQVGELLKRLRGGGLHGKAVISLHR